VVVRASRDGGGAIDMHRCDRALSMRATADRYDEVWIVAQVRFSTGVALTTEPEPESHVRVGAFPGSTCRSRRLNQAEPTLARRDAGKRTIAARVSRMDKARNLRT